MPIDPGRSFIDEGNQRPTNDMARLMPEMQTKGPESLNRYNSYKGMPFENFEAVAF